MIEVGQVSIPTSLPNSPPYASAGDSAKTEGFHTPEGDSTDTGPTVRFAAGEEPGCEFFFVFHTSFVPGSQGELSIPIKMMDKACTKARDA